MLCKKLHAEEFWFYLIGNLIKPEYANYPINDKVQCLFVSNVKMCPGIHRAVQQERTAVMGQKNSQSKGQACSLAGQSGNFMVSIATRSVQISFKCMA